MRLQTDLRCSVAVFRDHSELVVHRTSNGQDDFVLPGGSPEPGETTGACARREVLEETGLRVNPVRCAFVLEVIDPESSGRVVELIFTADGVDPTAQLVGEPGSTPEWVHLARLREVTLRPPIGGYLPALARVARSNTAPYLGNLWRPGESTDWLADPGGAGSSPS